MFSHIEQKFRDTPTTCIPMYYNIHYVRVILYICLCRIKVRLKLMTMLKQDCFYDNWKTQGVPLFKLPEMTRDLSWMLTEWKKVTLAHLCTMGLQYHLLLNIFYMKLVSPHMNMSPTFNYVNGVSLSLF